jgi:LysM repeat protein
MNNPNPFVPKGSLLEQQSVRRSRLKITVGCVLAVSVCALVAMLIDGCKREAPTDQTNTQPDLSAPANSTTTDNSSNMPPADISAPSNSAPMMATAPSNSVPTPPIPMAQITPPPQPPAEATAGSDYLVVSGDTLGKIAKAHGVTVKALEAANPGVDPKKLKIKQKLTIPAPTQSAAPDATSNAQMAMGGTGGETYVVKSGDTLSKIAKKHGVSLKALRAANASIASTDHIKVGEQLTIPAKGETAPTATTTDTSAPPVVPMPAPPAPGSTAPAPAPGH